MFAFGISRFAAQAPLFAAEPSMAAMIILGLVILVFVMRRPRRVKADRCRTHRGFPWKAAVLVVLIVVAWKRYHGPRFSWNLDLGDEIDAWKSAAGGGGFPSIEKKDLWALDRANDKARARSDEATRRKSARTSGAGVTSLNAAAAEKSDQPTAAAVSASISSPTDEARDLAEAVAPHVARSVMRARELTARAVEQARDVMAATGRDVAALKALTALKFVDADGHAPVPGQVAPAVAAAAAALAKADAVAGVPAEVPAVPTRFASPGVPTLPALPTAAIKTPAAPANDNVPSRMSGNLALDGEKAPPPIERKTPRIADPQRPDWIEHPGGRDGDIYYETVMVERYSTRAEAEDALAEELQTRTRAYLDRYLGAGASTLVTVPPAFIHDHLVKSRYEETVESSVGPMLMPMLGWPSTVAREPIYSGCSATRRPNIDCWASPVARRRCCSCLVRCSDI